MKSAKNIGRIVGVLLLIQIAGLIAPFVMLLPMTNTDFLTNAAANSFQIKAAVLLLLANCALTIGISITTFPVFREYNLAATVFLVALSAIMFSLQAVDNAHLMGMLALSQEYVRASGSDALFQTLSAVARSTRRWAHYPELLAIDSWIFVFYSLLYRCALVSRWLAGFGLITVLLHFAGITLPLFLGYSPVTLMGATMALSQTAIAIWLMVKGFKKESYV